MIRSGGWAAAHPRMRPQKPGQDPRSTPHHPICIWKVFPIPAEVCYRWTFETPRFDLFPIAAGDWSTTLRPGFNPLWTPAPFSQTRSTLPHSGERVLLRPRMGVSQGAQPERFELSFLPCHISLLRRRLPQRANPDAFYQLCTRFAISQKMRANMIVIWIHPFYRRPWAAEPLQISNSTLDTGATPSVFNFRADPHQTSRTKHWRTLLSPVSTTSPTLIVQG